MSIIWIQNRRYYEFDSYPTKEEAIITAKRLKRIQKVKTFIRTEIGGILLPEKNYVIYTNKPL